MIEFFTFSWLTRMWITLILGLCVLSQTLALILKLYSNRLNIRLVFNDLLEISLLFQILVFSILHGQIINGYKNGFVTSSGYESLRIFIFFLTLILVVFVCVLDRTLLPLSILPPAIISLPVMESILGSAFPWFFIGALIFFLGRSIKVCISIGISIKTSISALSITRAIDILHTGVLFSENNGYILLANQQMHNLMITIMGKVFRNSLEFHDQLVSVQDKSKYKKTELDGQMVYLLNDGTAWMFTKTKISLGIKNYIHISATDVTELWLLTEKLQDQDQKLKDKRDKLKETISNLHILSKKKEIENAKMRAHDILGQRLTVLLRTIQNEDGVDYDLLTSLSKGLLAELKAEQKKRGPYDELKSMQEIFHGIGVNINFEGNLPDSCHQSSLFIDIIRESSTNAVRHGLATQINIRSELIENEYKLTINNNGYTSISPITPGNGIKLMKKRVSSQAGNLDIIQYPQFTLSVVLPGDG